MLTRHDVRIDVSAAVVVVEDVEQTAVEDGIELIAERG